MVIKIFKNNNLIDLGVIILTLVFFLPLTFIISAFDAVNLNIILQAAISCGTLLVAITGKYNPLALLFFLSMIILYLIRNIIYFGDVGVIIFGCAVWAAVPLVFALTKAPFILKISEFIFLTVSLASGGVFFALSVANFQERLGLPYLNPNYIAYHFSSLYFLGTVYFSNHRNQAMWMLFNILIFSIVYLSGSRSGVLALFFMVGASFASRRSLMNSVSFASAGLIVILVFGLRGDFIEQQLSGRLGFLIQVIGDISLENSDEAHIVDRSTSFEYSSIGTPISNSLEQLDLSNSLGQQDLSNSLGQLDRFDASAVSDSRASKILFGEGFGRASNSYWLLHAYDFISESSVILPDPIPNGDTVITSAFKNGGALFLFFCTWALFKNPVSILLGRSKLQCKIEAVLIILSVSVFYISSSFIESFSAAVIFFIAIENWAFDKKKRQI